MKLTNKKLYSTTGLILIFLLFIFINLINHLSFKKFRLDLTSRNLYTLTDGTKNILTHLDDKVNLYFFFSQKTAQLYPDLQNYGMRVKDLLLEYQRIAGADKLNIKIIDPEAFSEEEDLATKLGIAPVSLNQNGTQVFFGLAGSNSVDGNESIAFFRLDREAYLEYEVSQLIYNLANINKSNVKIFSSFPLDGSQESAQGQGVPYEIYNQLANQYNVSHINSLSQNELNNTELLILINPAVDENNSYLIDQYVLSGGKVIFMIDPFPEKGSQITNAQVPIYAVNEHLEKLLKAWGVKISGNIVTDNQYATQVGGQNGQVFFHPGIISFRNAGIKKDIVTQGLETLIFSSMGSIEPINKASTQFTSLLDSSKNSKEYAIQEYFQFIQSLGVLATQRSQSDNKTKTLIAKITGTAQSAFSDKKQKSHIKSSENINVLFINDTDFLEDRFWVRVNKLFGQKLLTNVSDNGNFIINAIDTYLGSSDLISLRGRDSFSRPFDVVEKLKIQAQNELKDTEKRLQQRLQQTEREISQLQRKKDDSTNLILSSEQQRAIKKFQEDRIAVRKELRQVKFDLNKDINQLGTVIKLINILLVPLLIILVLILVNLYRKKFKSVAQA